MGSALLAAALALGSAAAAVAAVQGRSGCGTWICGSDGPSLDGRRTGAAEAGADGRWGTPRPREGTAPATARATDRSRLRLLLREAQTAAERLLQQSPTIAGVRRRPPPGRKTDVKRYLVEREIPGVGGLDGAPLKDAASTSDAAPARLGGRAR